VTNTNDMGSGSLRQAILGVNGVGGADTIDFNIQSPADAASVHPPASSCPNIGDC
jgi:hypothetical protein